MVDMKSRLPFEYQIIRSARKTLSVEIANGGVLVRSPKYLNKRKIEDILFQKQNWITKKLFISQKIIEANSGIKPLDDDDIKDLRKALSCDIKARCDAFASALGVQYKNITVRLQKTCWGSCSAKKNLNFNCLLMLCPESVRSAIAAHEVCHIKEMNHSKRFYELLYSLHPSYGEDSKWLSEHGKEIIYRYFRSVL